MAVTVLNDLKAPIEVKDPEKWKVVYPKQSLLLSSATESVTQVRLREEPAVQSTCERQGTLRASEDFGEVSTRGKDLDALHEKSVARDAKRRSMARERKRRLRQARKEFKAELKSLCCMVGSLLGVFPPLLFVFASEKPEHPEGAAGMAVMAALFCCCFSFFIAVFAKSPYNKFAACAFNSLCLAGLLGLAALVWMTIRHTQEGFWWTSLILWPAACCGCWRINNASLDEGTTGAMEVQEQELDSAKAEIQKRNICFEGSVIREVGRPCITSWPGKYEEAWERLVAESRRGQVSAAVVFLPDGTKDSGKHDRIPEEEGLAGTCWCTPLYGEQKPWGCRWWSKWMANVELAVKSGAQLDVYFMKGQVGKGKVESFDTAGSEHLRREKINAKRTDFKSSAEFQEASAAGLDGLSLEPCEDGSSRYTKEVDRLFLDWLLRPKQYAVALVLFGFP